MPNDTVVLSTIYNHAKYLDTYFDYLLLQTRKPFDLVIVDDSSTDNSASIIQEWIPHCKSHGINVTFHHHTKNTGVLGAITSARSYIIPGQHKYCSILEGDDYYYPEKLEKGIKFLEENPEFIAVHSDTTYLKPDGTAQLAHWKEDGRYDNNGNHFNFIPSGDIFVELIRNNFIMTCSLTFRPEALIYYDIAEFKKRDYYLLDYAWYLRMAKKEKVGYIDEPLAFYRINPLGASNNPVNRSKVVNDTYRLQSEAITGKL